LDHFTGKVLRFFAETDVPRNEGLRLIVAWPLSFARCAKISFLQVYELG
jgi:hypothetical protein